MKEKIMLVDDDGDIRGEVKDILEKEGYIVSTSNSGDECLNKLRNEKVDLILMDIMMPGTSPKEIVEKINGSKVAYFSKVMVTEREIAKLKENPKIAGFVKKPFQKADLIEKVKEYLVK